MFMSLIPWKLPAPLMLPGLGCQSLSFYQFPNYSIKLNLFELWRLCSDNRPSVLRQPGASILNFPLISGCWAVGRFSGPTGGGLVHQERHQSVRHPLRQHRGPHGNSPQQSPGQGLGLKRVLKTLMSYQFQLLPKLTNAIMDDIDKVLSNKPSRPAMVSTLQQRWAATGGMPPQ